MIADNLQEQLLRFFKALADANRLKIIGLLAQQSYTVEQLSTMLNLGASTVSHHLSRLAEAKLVEARPEGHFYYYSLHTENIRAMAQKLLSDEELPKLSGNVDRDAYNRKVLSNFLDSHGRIKSLPSQEKKFHVILRYVVKAFEPGRRYTERQVNEILSSFHDDTASLRRGLIEYRLMERQSGGGEYWRTDNLADS